MDCDIMFAIGPDEISFVLLFRKLRFDEAAQGLGASRSIVCWLKERTTFIPSFISCDVTIWTTTIRLTAMPYIRATDLLSSTARRTRCGIQERQGSVSYSTPTSTRKPAGKGVRQRLKTVSIGLPEAPCAGGNIITGIGPTGEAAFVDA